MLKFAAEYKLHLYILYESILNNNSTDIYRSADDGSSNEGRKLVGI